MGGLRKRRRLTTQFRQQLAVSGLLSAIAIGSPAAQSAPSRDTTRSQAYRNRVLGLFDQTTGDPVEGAEVVDVSTGWSAKTTATGTVSLLFLPEGGGLVRIRKVGYAPVLTKIAISPRDTAPITLLLSRVAELPAVVTRDTARHYISGNLNAFEERARMRVAGYFIMDSLLRKSENRSFSNLLRSQLPGAFIREAGFGSAYLTCGRGGTGGAPEVFVDGVAMKAGRFPFNLNTMQVSELQGVEYYPSGATMPAEYSSAGTSCGALMLWTRER
jgi:hypothetical protein